MVLFLAAALCGEAGAGTMGPIDPANLGWVVTLSAGPAWTQAGDTQTLFLTPAIERAYVVDSNTNALAAGELFLGMQKTNSAWTGQLGLALALAGNARVQGVIWDDADPEFTNYSFNYTWLCS